jgi:glycerol-3-phosphate dehydrogenase
MSEKRQSLLEEAAEGSWDVLVIGGGASGLAAAWDAVSRGLRVIVIDRGDFSKATSSRSTKLVHGGVRYLQNGELDLVREALTERRLLLRNAAEFTRPLRFVLPVTTPLAKYYYRFGMLLYDILAGASGIDRAKLLSPEETRERLPGIALEPLKGGVAYSDAQFDDSALAVAMAQAIRHCGGLALNYVNVVKLLEEGGKLSGASVKDMETGAEWDIRAKVVINATGIFSDELREKNRIERQWSIRTSRGSHIVCRREVMPGDHALIIPKTQDGRVLFAIPWKRHVVIGTTDVPTNGPVDDPSPTSEEIGFILAEAGRALGVKASDITSQWAGLRPLVGRRNAGSTASLSRKHIIEVSSTGLISVLGGKWTTCRKMGQDAIDAAISHHGLKAGKSTTADRILTEHGARIPTLDLLEESADFSDAELENRVIEATRFGFARTIEDVLARRMRLLFLDAAHAIRLAPRVADLMAQELDWSDQEKQAAVETFLAIAASYLP